MKLLNKLKIALLIAFFIIIFSNLKAFAVTGIVTEITVNMRKEPSTSSKRLMYVTQDYKVDVLEKVGDWYKIKYNGVTGYVYAKYVDVDESKLKTKNEEPKDTKNEDKTDENTSVTEKEPIQDIATDVQLELQLKSNSSLRLIPNITSSVIYTLQKESSVDVIEQLGEWAYVLVDNVYGWVRSNNIVEKNSEQTSINNEIEYTKRTVAYIKYSSVNLRKKASTSSTVLAKLKLNNEVIILEKVNSKWSKVEYDGITGYVSNNLLSSKKVEDKEKNSSTSRDGETVSREEKQETTIKVETTSNKNTETKKEETTEQVTNKENKKDTEIKKETETKTDTKNEESSKKETTKLKGEEIVEYAKQYLKYKYTYGGASPKTGFDCSGFTYYVYKNFGYTLSRSSSGQAKNGVEVLKSELQPGDLLIFKNQALTKIGHVGIYIGDNKMIHSSEPGVGVVITNLDANGYNYNKRYVTARRIVK